MLGIFENIRGAAQSFIRKGVELALSAKDTFTALVEGGLGYVESQFAFDFEVYDVQPDLMDRIYDLNPDYFILEGYHAELEVGVKGAYKYDLTSTWFDAEGNEMEVTRSVSTDVRQTFNEIQAEAESWPEDYEAEGWQRGTEWEMVFAGSKGW